MGFLSCLGLARPTNNRRQVSRGGAGGDTPAQSPPATASSWTAYRDTLNRPCWRNNLTGLWTYNCPHGKKTHNNNHIQLVQPPQQFWPVSPYPGSFHRPAPWSGIIPASPVLVFPGNPAVAAVEQEEEKKDDHGKKKKKGHWEEVFSELDGDKHWRHTGTNKTRDTDPYV